MNLLDILWGIFMFIVKLIIFLFALFFIVIGLIIFFALYGIYLFINDVLYATNLLIYGLNIFVTPVANAFGASANSTKSSTQWIDDLVNSFKKPFG